MKTVKAWAIIYDKDLCFALNETDSPLALFQESDEFLAQVVSREVKGSFVVPCEVVFDENTRPIPPQKIDRKLKPRQNVFDGTL